jgi:predicted negative regulator of RcsB-dependent stress response
MKTWLKENWFKLAIILLLLFCFYWYEWRPTQVKQRCSAEARFSGGALDRLARSDIENQKFINDYYNDCLMRFGLK